MASDHVERELTSEQELNICKLARALKGSYLSTSMPVANDLNYFLEQKGIILVNCPFKDFADKSFEGVFVVSRTRICV